MTKVLKRIMNSLVKNGMGSMKKVIQIIGLGMAGLMTWFSPMQVTHGINSCCAECVLKKEDEIEVVDEYVEDTTA